jgi:DUF971 family protein
VTAADIPLDIVLRPGELLLRWADGQTVLGAPALREACRCAECRAATLRGHSPEADGGVRMVGAAPVGQYALQLLFSDGHDRGIYPWELLRRLASR